MVDTSPKVRLVRCPKCCNLLPEPPGVPIYSCGGCGTFLQAKTSNAGRNKVGEQSLPNDNESRREENAAAEEEETVLNEAALNTGKENQSAAAAVDRDESSDKNGCCSNQSLQIRETAATGDIYVPHSEPQVEEKEKKIFEPRVDEEEEKNRNFDDEVEEVAVAGSVFSEPQVEEEDKNRNFESKVEEQEEENKNIEPQVEEEGKNRNFDDEVETTVAGSIVSDQIVAASNVSTSGCVIIEQEAAQNNGSAEETAREALCQETASSFAVEEQFQILDTYVGVINQEANKVRVINESESLPTRLDPVRGTHPTRHRTRSESYDQWGPRYGNKKFIDSSSIHSEQDKTELLRIMVLQLEEEVRRMSHSGQSSNSQAETGSSEMNRFYSGTLNRPRNRYSQPYSSPSSGFSSPQQQRRYYPPSSPSWDFETKSVDQLSNTSKFSYQQRERVHVPKRHVRAVAGGSPVVSCYRCSTLLQLPEDFLLSKRKRLHWLKCGSCSTLLRFSLQNGTHIVPYREGGPEENGKRETEEARRKRSSALHRLMGYSSVTQLVIGSGESSPSDQTSV